MAINVCRFAPSEFIPVVNYVKLTHELAKDAKDTRNLIKTLKTIGRLPPVGFDSKANDACLRNNRIMYERDEKTPTRGGNIAIY